MNIRAEVRSTQAAEGLPRRRFTVADVEAMIAAGVMDEDERVELVGGELVPMAAKGNRHEIVKVALLDRWVRARPDGVRVAPETTFRLSEDTYLEPDVVIYDRARGLKSLLRATIRPILPAIAPRVFRQPVFALRLTNLRDRGASEAALGESGSRRNQVAPALFFQRLLRG